MRTLIVAALAGLGLAQSASAAPARVAAAPDDRPPPLYDRAPWWMRSPLIAANGEVQTHIAANRAAFSAQFSAVDASVAAATRHAADQVRALARTLEAYGADKAQVETSLSITPIYQQYRDKEGQMQTYNQADRIEKYQANIGFNVQVRDLSVLERAYAATMSAHPTSIARIYFNLEPSNETNTALFGAAVADATRRAKLAADATGARLGRVMLIDPTGRACETDVLVAGATTGGGEDAGGLQEVVLTAEKRSEAIQNVPVMAPAPPPPPTPGEEVSAADLLPQQPPLESLQRKACVVYALE
jgi:uncharacterized protein YggE